MPAIEPIKPIETDELNYRAGISPIILITIGITVSLMAGFILVFVGSKGGGLDGSDYLFNIFAYIELFIGFVLFTIGIYSYPEMNRLSSFGWWIFAIAAWLEVFFISAHMRWGNICYGSYQNCVHRIAAIPYCLVPAIFILFGVALVYFGKRRSNKPVKKDQLKPKQNQDMAAQRKLQWGLTFSVALLIIALQIPTNWIILYIGGGYGPGTPYANFIVASILIAFLCCGCGGFVVGAMTGYRGAIHGISSALIAWVANMIVIYIYQGYITHLQGITSYFNGREPVFFIVLLVVSLIIAIGFGGLSGVLGARLRKRYIYN